MAKVIRPTYPKEISIGLLLLVFAIAFFLSHMIFKSPPAGETEGTSVYVGMTLVSIAVIVMCLVLWEEFLFPIKIRRDEDHWDFRNHRNKLKTQLLIYFAIPAIFAFIYLEYEVNEVRYWAWAAVVLIAPVAGKLITGINNYNDFLKVSNEFIEYKNNAEEGKFPVTDIKRIVLVKDDRKVLHKIQLYFKDGKEVTIDIDEMELHDFYEHIDKFMLAHYKELI
ncbi:MAG TPA: magnesium transporter [Cyclobacteriaceae bacterium]|nr:magnesium transporter [Cyclobacteriaceae bacterium]